MSQTEVQLIKADAVQTGDIANSAVTDAKISGVASSKLTGALPAISGAALTNLPEGAGKAQNLIINGAMQVAQRGTSSTAGGYCSVDRFRSFQNGLDEAPTYSQGDVTSGGAYNSGFRKSFKITNGNQTSAGADDHIVLEYRVEDQDLATSGWNYLSSSSNISFSFWVKSSVAQNFYFGFQSDNGSQYRYVMETGSLTADTWTKITKTIPGNSNLVFNNDNGIGMYINWHLYNGTNRTGTRPLNAWAALDNASRTPDDSSTWYTTNDATFEITGVQLEVGDSATDFNHESFAETLRKCQRYFQVLVNTESVYFGMGYMYDHYRGYLPVQYYVEMRAAPSFQFTSGTNYYSLHRAGTGDNFDGWNTVIGGDNKHSAIQAQSGLSGTGGDAGAFWSGNANSKITFEAEL